MFWSNPTGPRETGPGPEWGGYGYGPGPGWWGWGPGFGWGPPWGFRPPFWGWGPMAWGGEGYGPGPWAQPTREEEIAWLKEQAEMLKAEMEAVKRRIDELAAEEES